MTYISLSGCLHTCSCHVVPSSYSDSRPCCGRNCVLKKHEGLFGIGLKLQHKSAPSNPSQLHSSQLLLGDKQKTEWWGIPLALSNRKTRTFKHKKSWKNLPHLAFAFHHSFHSFQSHLHQCEMPINRAYKQCTSGTQPHPAHPAACTHSTRQVKGQDRYSSTNT